MCGEKPVGLRSVSGSSGSPPHVRGKALCGISTSVTAGITPACAGKRLIQARHAVKRQDHPRMCGEKAGALSCRWRWTGSPPHVRGKAHFVLFATAHHGITPACAGKRLKRSRSTVPHAAIVPLFPSVCNKPAGSDGSPAGHDAPPFLPIENAAPASPAYNLRSL